MLASLPLPVAIISAETGGERSCSTGTVSYISIEPPLVAVPLSSTSRTADLARRSGELSVSLLDASQAELAVRAARPGAGDKFAEQRIPVLEPPLGAAAPAVAGSASVFWCRVVDEHAHGGVVLLVAEIRSHTRGDGSPLLRYDHAYRGLGPEVRVAEEAAYPL